MKKLAVQGVLMLLALGSAPSAEAQTAPLWSHTSGAEGWTGRIVSLGNSGSQVISQFGPFFDHARIFSGYDQNPPTPLVDWVSTQATFHHQVDAAETRDLAVSIFDVYADATLSTRRVHIKRFSTAQPATNWSYQHPTLTNGTDRLSVRVSRDGSRIVAGIYNFQTNKTDVVVFGPDSPTPVASFAVDTQIANKAFELSADGTHLLVASNTMVRIYAVPAGTLLHTELMWEANYNAFAISGNGSHFAWGATNKAKLYKKGSNGSYALLSEPAVGASGTWACDRLKLSDDSSTLITAYNLTDTFRTVRVQAIDTATLQATMASSLTGTGNLQVCVADLSSSADGSRFALANWGDANGQVAEVLVFDSHQNSAVRSIDLAGSALAVDLAADGRRVAVASKAVHANQSGSGGKIELYSVETEDVGILGAPRAGTTVTARVLGPQASLAWMLVSPSLRPTPLVFPGLGTLYLGSTGLVRLPMGPVNAQGVASNGWTLPNTPGTTLYLQGFTTQPRQLGEDCLPVTILP